MPNVNPASPTPLKPKLRETSRVWRKLLYSKIENIFLYDNLPKEIPKRLFNLMLFRTGKTVFYKIGEKYTVQPFSYNDILNWYYVPLKGRVVNPYLPVGHQNWEFDIEDECVIYNSSPDIQNYRQFSMTADLIFKTANQLAENDISYYCIQRNSRLIALFTAQTDLQKREMDKVINKMYEGESDITMTEDLISHVQANPLSQNSTRNSITELIEFQQYILANFYHSFGINSNYNLKREQLNSDEINVNQEVLRLNIEDMLKCREDGVEKINEKFGLNVTVRLNEKLYATLLQQANLFQSGTIDPETGLQNTNYVDPNKPENIKQFQFGTESEDENAQKIQFTDKTDSSDLFGRDNSDSSGNDSSSRDGHEPGSDDNTDRRGDSGDKREDKSVRGDDNEASSDMESQNNDTQRKNDTYVGSEQKTSKGYYSVHGETEFSGKSGESSGMGTDDTSETDDRGTDRNNDTTVINVNIQSAEDVSISNPDSVTETPDSEEEE